MKKCNTT